MTAQHRLGPVPRERELHITRLFDAPRDLVFWAWTDSAQIARWMGPRGYTAQYVAHDVRPGGAWRACLRRDDGGEELWQSGVFHEVVPPERLVFTFAWDGDDHHSNQETLVTVTLSEQGDQTRMTFQQTAFETVAQRDSHQGGWSSSFDRLEDFLGDNTHGH